MHTMKLTHIFKLQCPNIQDLIGDSVTLKQYCKRIITKSKEQPDRIDPNVYLGDAFELLCEALILSHGADSCIGVSNYSPISIEDDYGVDGIGTGTNGKVATVQCKFKSNKTDILSINNDHLGNFTSASWLHCKVDYPDTNNMLILTTAKGLSHIAKDMYTGKVRCLGYNEIATLIDNNINFWNKFREALII